MNRQLSKTCSDDKPITAVIVIEDILKCPKGFTVVNINSIKALCVMIISNLMNKFKLKLKTEFCVFRYREHMTEMSMQICGKTIVSSQKK